MKPSELKEETLYPLCGWERVEWGEWGSCSSLLVDTPPPSKRVCTPAGARGDGAPVGGGVLYLGAPVPHRRVRPSSAILGRRGPDLPPAVGAAPGPPPEPRPVPRRGRPPEPRPPPHWACPSAPGPRTPGAPRQSPQPPRGPRPRSHGPRDPGARTPSAPPRTWGAEVSPPVPPWTFQTPTRRLSCA